LQTLKNIAMNKDDIKKYREDCGSDARDIHKELDDRVSFIIIAAIGFFVTKSDSFYPKGNGLMIALYCCTLLCLFLSFVIFLLNKHLAIKEINDHLEFIDTKMKPDTPELAQKLITDWEAARNRREKFQRRVYVLLIVGFITGITFFMISTLSRKDSEKIPQPFKIEMH